VVSRGIWQIFFAENWVLTIDHNDIISRGMNEGCVDLALLFSIRALCVGSMISEVPTQCCKTHVHQIRTNCNQSWQI